MAQFFAYPLNYGGGRSQYKAVADNDYNTSTDQTSMLLHIDTAGDGSGDARDFTDIFIKCSGVASYTIQMTDPKRGIGLLPRVLPASVRNDSGVLVPIEIEGIQNDLYDLHPAEVSGGSEVEKLGAKSLTLTFTAVTGETPRIYEVMVLDRLLTINSDGGFSRIDYNSIDLGTVEPDLRKRLSYIPPINAERDKWHVDLTYTRVSAIDRNLLSRNSVTGYSRRSIDADDLIRLIRRYKRFVFAAEYNRYPDRVFPALWPSAETQIRYISRWKGSGRRVSFSVREA